MTPLARERQINGTRKCEICNERAVAQCTHEETWHLCELHARSAAGNGFLPRLYGAEHPITPDKLVRVDKP